MKTTTVHRTKLETQLLSIHLRCFGPVIRIGSSVLLAFSMNVSAANLITNGSLDGSTADHSLVPFGWTDFNRGTTDTVSASGHPFALSFGGIGSYAYTASPNGGTFAFSADYSGPERIGTPEGLSQTVNGLLIGQTYRIRFEFTNLALYDNVGNIATNAFFVGQNYNSAGRWLIKKDGVLIGSTPTISPFSTPGTQTWSVYSLVTTATSAASTFDFSADWAYGPGTHVGMGIDGISIEQVPEPGVGLIMFIGIAGLLMNRQTCFAR